MYLVHFLIFGYHLNNCKLNYWIVSPFFVLALFDHSSYSERSNVTGHLTSCDLSPLNSRCKMRLAELLKASNLHPKEWHNSLSIFQQQNDYLFNHVQNQKSTRVAWRWGGINPRTTGNVISDITVVLCFWTLYTLTLIFEIISFQVISSTRPI